MPETSESDRCCMPLGNAAQGGGPLRFAMMKLSEKGGSTVTK